MYNKKTSKKGFTLVETMIVVGDHRFSSRHGYPGVPEGSQDLSGQDDPE